MIFLLDFCDISKLLLSDVKRISMGMKEDFYVFFMVFLWEFFGFPIGFSWYLSWISMTFLLDSCEISMICLYGFHVKPIEGIPMGLPWQPFGISMMFL